MPADISLIHSVDHVFFTLNPILVDGGFCIKDVPGGNQEVSHLPVFQGSKCIALTQYCRRNSGQTFQSLGLVPTVFQGFAELSVKVSRLFKIVGGQGKSNPGIRKAFWIHGCLVPFSHIGQGYEVSGVWIADVKSVREIDRDDVAGIGRLDLIDHFVLVSTSDDHIVQVEHISDLIGPQVIALVSCFEKGR